VLSVCQKIAGITNLDSAVFEESKKIVHGINSSSCFLIKRFRQADRDLHFALGCANTHRGLPLTGSAGRAGKITEGSSGIEIECVQHFLGTPLSLVAEPSSGRGIEIVSKASGKDARRELSARSAGSA
jgi:hypothetical protein